MLRLKRKPRVFLGNVSIVPDDGIKSHMEKTVGLQNIIWNQLLKSN